MGDVVDFFKPVNAGTTAYCEMLQAYDKHQWSPNGVDWFAVEFANSYANGGSAEWWPRDKGLEGDAREHLSFWGIDDGRLGGCCSTSTAVSRTDGGRWSEGVPGVPFTLSYALLLQPLPPNIGMSLAANVPGTTLANDAYWAAQCETIPTGTLFLVLDMGTVRDFFKPADAATTYCEMLQARDKHQWSPDGVNWFAVTFLRNSGHNGGSALWWPRDNSAEWDAREHLSFWGNDGTVTGGCCSTSTAVANTTTPPTAFWHQSFTVSYALLLQPLPPNTGMSLVANVPGTTVANDAYWSDACKIIPTGTLFLVLDMGTVRDFFRPADVGTTYCEMLQEVDKHQWSPNGVDWFAVDFVSSSSHNGGSAAGWPKGNAEGDARSYLSFWGYDGHYTLSGGCCSSSTSVEQTYPSLPDHTFKAWGQSFTVSYALLLQPLPPNTGMSLVANVPGTTLANDAYWAAQCKTIPSSTLFLVLDMGTVRDFFKPVNASTTYCEMLQAHDKHQWSPNGVDWFAVDFTSNNVNNGGSAAGWPRDNAEGDARKYLSFWGHGVHAGESHGRKGGCCSTSTAVQTGGWNLPLSLSYALPEFNPLPPNIGMSLVANVPGTTVANDAYWAAQCKTIPSSTLFLVLDMGTVRDFFKPADAGTTYCEMLQAHNKHQWSPNGVDWFAVTFANTYDNGGSAEYWPRDKGLEGDAREHLSFWGIDDGRLGGCCSTSTAVNRTDEGGWTRDVPGVPFALSYALLLQPLPPNIGMSLVANVPGTTLANDAYWAARCETIPSSTLFLVLDMGTVRDFFKPADAGTTYCEMLQAVDKHQWSPDGVDWFIVNYFGDKAGNGGSAEWWPRDKGREGDARKHLSFWGVGVDTFKGGCCSTSTAVDVMSPAIVGIANNIHWGHPFTVSYALLLQPLPPNTGMSLVANVPGTTLANDAYWAEQCKTIPASTLFLVLDMGTVRDFFKPADAATTYCEMLQAHNKHQWSPNGVDWFAVEFYNKSDCGNGGSAEWWPQDKGREGDARKHLSYWGREKDGIHTGGCCSTSTLVGDTANPGWWGEPFTLSYGYGDLDVNATCDPVADMCNQAKRLVCLDPEYKCRYATTTSTFTTISTSTAIAALTSASSASSTFGSKVVSSATGGGVSGATVPDSNASTTAPESKTDVLQDDDAADSATPTPPNLGAILGATLAVLALALGVAAYVAVSKKRRTAGGAHARAAVQQEYQNDEDRRNTLPMQLNPHAVGPRRSPSSAATAASTRRTGAATATTAFATGSTAASNASTGDDKYGNVVYSSNATAAGNEEDASVGAGGSAEYSVVSRPAAASSRVGAGAGPMPSHDNYSGYTIAAPQAGVVYSVPVAEEDEDDNYVYKNGVALDAAALPPASADASGVYDMGPPGERAPRPGAANSSSGPYSGYEAPRDAVERANNASAAIVYATPALEEGDVQQTQRHVERTPNAIYTPHIPGGNRNVERFPNPLYGGGGGPDNQAGSSEL